MTFQDRIIICRDCGSSFSFTSGEQSFYSERGLTNDPARCPSCRHSRKAGSERPSDALGQGYVNYGPFASFGGRNPRQMHPASCDRCGEVTEVPFVPRGDRPVYCSECFSQIRSQEPEDAAQLRDRHRA